jgi:hypothetical protein
MRGLRSSATGCLLGLVVLGLAQGGCKRKPSAQNAPEEAPAELLSALEAGDPRAPVQLTRGFHGLEQNSWRWTAGRFSVVLAPPEGAAEKGARLELKLHLPEVVVSRVGAVTLSASAGGERLAPQTYAASGDYVYARDIPARIFGSGAIPIEFATDKALPATADDNRELALIVTSVGLFAP